MQVAAVLVAAAIVAGYLLHALPAPAPVRA